MEIFDHDVELVIPGGFFGNSTRILPPNGSLMDLAFLRQALQPDHEYYVERLLPPTLFVREEMELAMHELLKNRRDTVSILSGSPGIGKSVLCFLMTLYSVWKNDVKAVYLRCVNDTFELVSMFAMNRLLNGNIRIRFTREWFRSGNMPQVFEKNLRAAFTSEGMEWSSSELFAVLDGPTSDQFTHYTKLRIGCTTGAGMRLKHHMADNTFNIVMGAWTKDTLEAAIRKQLDPGLGETEFDQQKFNQVYFVTGGKIRWFLKHYRGEMDTTFADHWIRRVFKDQSALSLSNNDGRSTCDYINGLGSVFRKAGGRSDSISMHVDSQYMLRGLRDQISGSELFNSYKRAEATGNKGAQAGYFEEMMHWCYSNLEAFQCLASYRHADKRLTEGVAELTEKNQYWIPSIPNFANVDSAIVGSDDRIWCFQFTISRSHSYRKGELQTQFLNRISFLTASTDETTIVYVVPHGTAFSAPTQDEVADKIDHVDCTSLQSVLESAAAIVKHIAS